jgi:hypothetical protein
MNRMSSIACTAFLALVPNVYAATPASPWPAVDGTWPRSELGSNDVALVAGTSRPFVLPPIPGASETATDWYRFFVDARGVPVENAVLLRDADVTKENLLAEAARLKKRLGPSGTFWLVFIGHGAPALTGDDGKLLGVDVQPTIRSIDDRGVSQQTLLSAAGRERVVAIFDACFSGVRSDGSGEPLVPGAQATLPVRRSSAATATARAILQASENIAGPLPGHDRPAFSYLLLGALRGWADDDGDGVVRLGDAFAYAKKALAVTVRTRSQVPSMLGDGNVVGLTNARETGPSLTDVVSGKSSSQASLTTSHLPLSSPSRRALDTLDVKAAEDAWQKRRIVPTPDGFVRGAYAAAIAEENVLRDAEALAPDAVAVVREVTGRQAQARAIGVGVGVAGVVGGGSLGYLSMQSALVTPELAFVGAFTGATLGILLGLTTSGVLYPPDSDQQRLSRARGDIANALNDAERAKLGL